MSMKKDLVIPEEIDSCLRYVSNNKSAQEQLLKLLQETVQEYVLPIP
jgi:hypothetical protein